MKIIEYFITYSIFIAQLLIVLLVGILTWNVIHLSGAQRAQDIMVTMPLFMYGFPLSIIQYLVLISIKYFKRKNNFDEDKHIEYISNINIKIPIIFFLIFISIISTISL
jgi:heme/copper-type cytochrome/quinol oxidase subunit 2